MLSERVDSTQLSELARKGIGLDLRLPVANLARLPVCLYSSGKGQDSDESEELAANVQFGFGSEGLPQIELSISGHLSLQCQRCLDPVIWPVQIDTCLTVLNSDEQTELIASPFDSVSIDVDGLDLAIIIEDEILAALPMVPVHTGGPNCQATGGLDINSETDAELMQKPFADLAGLVGSRKSKADD